MIFIIRVLSFSKGLNDIDYVLPINNLSLRYILLKNKLYQWISYFGYKDRSSNKWNIQIIQIRKAS